MDYVIKGFAILGAVVVIIFIFNCFRDAGGYVRSPIAFQGEGCGGCGTGYGGATAEDYNTATQNYRTLGR